MVRLLVLGAGRTGSPEWVRGARDMRTRSPSLWGALVSELSREGRPPQAEAPRCLGQDSWAVSLNPTFRDQVPALAWHWNGEWTEKPARWSLSARRTHVEHW